MAEFVQTMKDWRRMCITANDGPDTTKCGNCPLGETRLCSFEISDIGDYELQEAETFINTWAADHPEPVYPTWEQYLADLMTADMKADKTDNPNSVENYMRKTRIPADLAQKLGIEPKEGT